jgi:hypothetical protein
MDHYFNSSLNHGADQTHRLGRRFGNDRFLELDIPQLAGATLPKVMQDAGAASKSIIIQWLISEMHNIFGRHWSPFHTKPKDGKERKTDTIKQGELDVGTAHRIYLFAVDGVGFRDNAGTPKESETIIKRSAMSVQELLDWIRSTNDNGTQSFLKLFDRTSLGMFSFAQLTLQPANIGIALSRNTPTVVLQHSQIRPKDDIESNGEVMNDGGGRLSLRLALKIVEIMGLSYLPSGFQARLGGVKGVWVVDPGHDRDEDWIEVYKSQRKWERDGTEDDQDYDDPAHRTFEVNNRSDKLQSARLNL